MTIDWARLASALAQRLGQAAPEGVEVRADGDVVALSGALGWGSIELDLNPDMEPDEDEVTHAAWRALDGLQDLVATSTAEIWPSAATLPIAFARIDGTELRLGYERALELEPIPLDGIVSD